MSADSDVTLRVATRPVGRFSTQFTRAIGLNSSNVRHVLNTTKRSLISESTALTDALKNEPRGSEVIAAELCTAVLGKPQLVLVWGVDIDPAGGFRAGVGPRPMPVAGHPVRHGPRPDYDVIFINARTGAFVESTTGGGGIHLPPVPVIPAVGS